MSNGEYDNGPSPSEVEAMGMRIARRRAIRMASRPIRVKHNIGVLPHISHPKDGFTSFGRHPSGQFRPGAFRKEEF